MSRLSAALLLVLASCRTAPPPAPDRPGIASRKVSAAIMCAALSPDEREIALGLQSGCVLRVQLSDLTVTVHQPGHADWVISLAYLDNDTILSGAGDGLRRWRRTADGSVRMDRIPTIKDEVMQAGFGSCTSAVARVAVSPRRTAAAYITFAGDLVVLDATLTTTLAWRRFPMYRPMGLEFLDETQVAVTGWGAKGTHVWAYTGRTDPFIVRVPDHHENCLATLGTGPGFVTGSGSSRMSIATVQRGLTRQFGFEPGVTVAVAANGDGSLIACGFSCSTNGPDHAVVIDAAGRTLYATTLPGTLRVVLLTRDGSTLIAGGDAGILWRLPLPAR